MKTWLSGLLVTVVLLLTVVLAEAQQTKNIPRIGYLGLSDPSSSLFDSFRQGLRELGYLEGQNIIIEARFAFGNDWRLNELAAELARSKIDVILTQGSSALSVARSYTKTIPIVMTVPGDPVAAGIVKSLERPGGNVTGLAGLAAGLGGKWLELLKETVPEASRVGVLFTRGSLMMKELEPVARSLRVELQPGLVPLRSYMTSFSSADVGVGVAFTRATRGGVDAFLVLPSLEFEKEQHYIADLALRTRLPGLFWLASFVEAGGLMAYGANPVEQSRRAAYYVDKILKGAKPAELPIELPKKFELTINLKTAKEIGIAIPPRVLAWADKVIK